MRRSKAFVLGLVLGAGSWSCGASQADDEISLGRTLFSDRNLSADRKVSCSLCHQPNFLFAEGRIASTGVGGGTEVRKTPSLLDLREYTAFFWDGRAADLREQIRGPFFSPVELGFNTEDEVVQRVRENASHVKSFALVYGTSASEISFDLVAKALVAFEKAIPARTLRIDRFLGGDSAALSFQARQGMQIFTGRAGCAACHVITGHSAPLTDNQFHASSVGIHSSPSRLSVLLGQVSDLTERERFKHIAADPEISDLGRFVVTLRPGDVGKFRTPSLRHTAGAYHSFMHDGSLSTLRDAIDQEIAFRGIERGRGLDLSPGDREDIRVFLEELSQAADLRR
jgi:cytochrome c peroxidase